MHNELLVGDNMNEDTKSFLTLATFLDNLVLGSNNMKMSFIELKILVQVKVGDDDGVKLSGIIGTSGLSQSKDKKAVKKLLGKGFWTRKRPPFLKQIDSKLSLTNHAKRYLDDLLVNHTRQIAASRKPEEMLYPNDPILINEILDKAYPDQCDVYFKAQAAWLIHMSVALSNTNQTSQLMNWIKTHIIDGNFSEVLRVEGDNKAVNEAVHPYLCSFFSRPMLKAMQNAKKERQPSLLIDNYDSRHAHYVASEISHGWHSDAMFSIKSIAEKVVFPKS